MLHGLHQRCNLLSTILEASNTIQAHAVFGLGLYRQVFVFGDVIFHREEPNYFASDVNSRR